MTSMGGSPQPDVSPCTSISSHLHFCADVIYGRPPSVDGWMEGGQNRKGRWITSVQQQEREMLDEALGSKQGEL